MTIFGVIFLAVTILMLLFVPRRWAPVPLIVGACYMTLGQMIEIGPFHFTFIRLAIAAGVFRVILRGERAVGGVQTMDWLVGFWGAWSIFSGFFQPDVTEAVIYRLGGVYNSCGIYILMRIFCQSLDDVVMLCRVITILLVPVAISMICEKFLNYNIFSVFGGVEAMPAIRYGKIRAQGPFRHPILAGTIGALCLPFVAALWKEYRRESFCGIAACLAMVFACASSGPIFSAAAAVLGLYMWRYREKMRNIRWVLAFGYIMLDLIMQAPAYYVLARFDLLGGSTGWHRAALMQSAFRHLGEWWLVGTSYTRHWMPYGLGDNPKMCDLTNNFIAMGAYSGLPLMILHVLVIVKGFAYVGILLRDAEDYLAEYSFIFWSLGVSIFVYVVSSFGVSYFDQSFLFVYLVLAGVTSTYASIVASEKEEALVAYA